MTPCACKVLFIDDLYPSIYCVICGCGQVCTDVLTHLRFKHIVPCWFQQVHALKNPRLRCVYVIVTQRQCAMPSSSIPPRYIRLVHFGPPSLQYRLFFNVGMGRVQMLWCGHRFCPNHALLSCLKFGLERTLHVIRADCLTVVCLIVYYVHVRKLGTRWFMYMIIVLFSACSSAKSLRATSHCQA